MAAEWMQLAGALGVGGLLGTIGTQWATARREKVARRITYKRQQLQELYGPLLSMRSEIQARSELRVKLQEAIDRAHVDDLLKDGPGSAEEAVHIPAIFANVQDENDTFREVLMPRYRQMIDTFRDKMWLSEQETRKFFPHLVEFVDVWDKILAEKVPRTIATTINHTERNLTPFYEHIAEVHDRLQSEIQ